MHNDEFTQIPDDLSRSGEQLRIEGVELIRICVRPQRQSGDTPYHAERAYERVHDICTAEAVFGTAELGELGVFLVGHT